MYAEESSRSPTSRRRVGKLAATLPTAGARHRRGATGSEVLVHGDRDAARIKALAQAAAWGRGGGIRRRGTE
jgi:hypothetical protein